MNVHDIVILAVSVIPRMGCTCVCVTERVFLLQMSKVEVTVFCGSREPEISGMVEIVDESSRACQKPRVISLTNIKLDPGARVMPPCLYSCPTSSQHSHRAIHFLPQSPNQSTLYPIQLVLLNDEVVELFYTSEDDQRQWGKRLGLLLIFPFSPIPHVPTSNPAMRSLFWTTLDPRNFKAGGTRTL